MGPFARNGPGQLVSFVFVDVAERPVVDNVSNVQPADFFECPLLAESGRRLTLEFDSEVQL